jgi:hypothetical protein
MKKIALLLTIFCVGVLNAMEKPEPTCDWQGLYPEAKALIVQTLPTYTDPNAGKALEYIIETIKSLRLTNKELCEIVDDLYANQRGFTALVHILADKFDLSSKAIAEKFKTLIAHEYVKLGLDLLKFIQCRENQKAIELINKGADANFTDLRMQGDNSDNAYYSVKMTPLFYAVNVVDLASVKLLLNSGANPHFKNRVFGTALEGVLKGIALSREGKVPDIMQNDTTLQKALAIKALLEDAIKK